MATGRLLVVVQDADLRASLVFALEAEGHDVTDRATLPTLAEVTAGGFDCTVLDQKALVGEAYEAIAFCIKAHPVVLMAGRPHAWLTDWCAQVLVTPAGEGALSAAVVEALAARDSVSSPAAG